MNFQVLVASIYLACGAILLFLGVVILREDPRNRVNRVTSLMLFFAGLGPLLASLGTFIRSSSQADSFVASPFTHNIFYVWEFFFPFLLLFSLIFPQENRYLKKYPRLKYLIFLPHIFHTILVLVFYEPGRIIQSVDVEKMGSLAKFFLEPISLVLKYVAVLFGIVYDIHVQSFSLINLIFLIMAVWFLHRGYKRVMVPTLKRQVEFLIWGIRSSVGLYTVAFIVPALTPLELPETLRYFLTIAALVVGSGSIAWAIIKHHFLDVKLIVRQSLVYFATSALFVGLYFLIIRQFGRLLQNLIGTETPAVDVAFVIVAIIFFQPIMGQLDDLIKRFFIREKSDYRAMMETFSRKLVTIFDLEALRETVVDTLKKEMLVEKVCIAIPHSKEGGTTKNNGYRLFVDEPRSEDGDPFGRDDPLLLTLKEKTRPTPLADFKMLEETSPVLKRLTGLGVFLVVPLISQKELMGFIGLSKKTTRFRYSYEDITLLGVLANQMVIAMSNARLYQESLEKQRLEEELGLARQIQLGLLPKFCPKSEYFELSAHIHPATQVGGDYYDFLYSDSGSVGIAIADASGKGIPAALLISLVHASLRAEVKNRLSPPSILSNINDLIFSSTSSEKFATMFYGELHPTERRLSYCNAGHNYPLVIRQDGSVEFLDKGGMILGAFAETIYEGAEVILRKNDTLFFYSDGLTDNFNSKEEEFGEQRLLDLLIQNRSLGAEELKEKVIEEAASFSEGTPPYDDLTLVVLKIY
ncbi:MAG: GAF domain-containing SpoIIE family protein phosphatase [Candidatus Zixiibacteriota bacterium]